MLQTRFALLTSLLVLAASMMAQEQTKQPSTAETKLAETQPAADAKPATDGKPAADAKPATGKLPFKAALVLTPEFCQTKIKPKGSIMTKELGSFDVGQAACKEFEPALKDVFSSLTRVAAPPSAEEAQLVLVPKIADVSVTTASMAFSNRELVVMIEWTVKDSTGKTVWLETVQGSAKHHQGNLFTFRKNQGLIVTDSMKAAAAESATKMSASSELHKLTPGN
jgi:hypothetical protein